MNLLFFASGEFAVPTLRWLHGSGHSIRRVITQPDRPAGRGRKTTPTPVNTAALELGIATMAVENVNDPSVVAELESCGAHAALVIAFGQKIGRRLLDAFPKGCLNLHASLLPKYRGAAPINAAILQGETETGVTVFRLVEKMDAGPILISRALAIRPEETAGELHDRLANMGPDIVAEALNLLSGDANPPGTPQDETLATQAPKLNKAEGRLDFRLPAEALLKKIRGYTPWPGAWCEFVSAKTGKKEQVLITRAGLAAAEGSSSPGTLTGDLAVGTASGALQITEIKPAASKNMTWRDFVNGRHVTAADRFE